MGNDLDLLHCSNGKKEDLPTIFRRARGGLSLRLFVDKLGGAVAYSTLARIERGEVEIPTDEVLAAVAPYTRPYKSVLELKALALGVRSSNAVGYDEVLAAAKTLSNADRVRLIQALVEDLGRL